MVVEEKRETGEENIQVPDTLPVLPIKKSVIFPFMIVPIVVKTESLVRMVDETLAVQKMIGVFTQKDPSQEEVGLKDLFSVGTAALIYKMLRLPDGSIRLLVQGVARIRIEKVLQEKPHLLAKIGVLEEIEKRSNRIDILMRSTRSSFEKLVDASNTIPDELKIVALNIDEPGRLADLVASNLPVGPAEKQAILEEQDPELRLERLAGLLARELQLTELGRKIESEVKTEINKEQRQYYLRQQLRAIQRELGETDEKTQELEELRQKIEKVGMSEEAKDAALKELDRLEKMPPAAAEYTVARTYLDWLTGLPWRKVDGGDIDISRAAKILDEDHYDLEKVKERILEFLAVRKLKRDSKGPILCLVGPPGVGKTSLGKSIARALGRKFHRISLGGMRDEAEIRGHRRTYIGALPGRIIQGIRTVKSRNPVFMLDEIDKIGVDFRGDPASALLEVLDPEQNAAFSDHYLSVPFDLSQVMFITTANLLEPIPPVLRDRMEVLELPGYTNREKLMIAKRYLVERQLTENGLTPKQLKFTDAALSRIICEYTREAGVRNVEREIAKVCRKVATRVARGRTKVVTLKRGDVPAFLGPEKFISETAERKDDVGVATGLAWTSAGGTILFVEAVAMPGKGGLILTGSLGQVMKESAQAALSLVRSRAEKLGTSKDFFSEHDFHIHVPAGATPKDGPSAGVTIFAALVSLVSGRKTAHDVGMTGEITLRGRVLPVGGIRQKAHAAQRAGLRKLIVPARNRNDVEELPPEIKKQLKFIFVETVDEAIQHALRPAGGAKSRRAAPRSGAASRRRKGRRA